MKQQSNKVNEQKVINPASFYQSLKLVGQTLGMEDKKFIKLIPSPLTTPHQVMAQRHQIGYKILNEILDEELQDLN